MELRDTVAMMQSEDYKDRFKAEYHQTKIRYERLKAFNNKIEAANLTAFHGGAGVEMPKHDCPEEMLREQQNMMGHYLHILEVRAVIEGISL
jgi:uridine kinase